MVALVAVIIADFRKPTNVRQAIQFSKCSVHFGQKVGQLLFMHSGLCIMSACAFYIYLQTVALGDAAMGRHFAD